MIEKQVISLLPDLNRAELLRVLEAIVSELKIKEEEGTEIRAAQWERMDHAVENFRDGDLETIDLDEVKARVRALRNK